LGLEWVELGLEYAVVLVSIGSSRVYFFFFLYAVYAADMEARIAELEKELETTKEQLDVVNRLMVLRDTKDVRYESIIMKMAEAARMRDDKLRIITAENNALRYVILGNALRLHRTPHSCAYEYSCALQCPRQGR
jgi:hypothetical protein